MEMEKEQQLENNYKEQNEQKIEENRKQVQEIEN